MFSCAHDSLIYPPSLVSVTEPRYVPMGTCFVYHFSWVGFVNCHLGMSYAQKKENGKRRKVEEQNASKKTKDKKVSCSSSWIHHCKIQIDWFWYRGTNVMLMSQVVDVDKTLDI